MKIEMATFSVCMKEVIPTAEKDASEYSIFCFKFVNLYVTTCVTILPIILPNYPVVLDMMGTFCGGTFSGCVQCDVLKHLVLYTDHKYTYIQLKTTTRNNKLALTSQQK